MSIEWKFDSLFQLVYIQFQNLINEISFVSFSAANGTNDCIHSLLGISTFQHDIPGNLFDPLELFGH